MRSDTRTTRLDLLLVALTAIAGCTDAISYESLGRVFPANMTGNTVLLGLSLATHGSDVAAGSAVALAAYVFGAGITGFVVVQYGWSHQTDRVVAVEGVLLAVVGCWWLVVDASAAGGARFASIALAAAAMGAQGAVIGQVGVPGISTTYITGTWTGLSAGTARRLGRRIGPDPDQGAGPAPDRLLQAFVVAAYLLAAFLGGLAVHTLHRAAFVLPAAVLLGVAAFSVVSVRRSGRAHADRVVMRAGRQS